MIRFVARTYMYPPCWVLKVRIQKHRGKPLLFHDTCKCPGFFYVHYTTHGTYSFTSHPKDEAIMVKCLAQGHKHHDRPGRDSNSHSGNTRTWVQCTRPLGHKPTTLQTSKTANRLSGLCPPISAHQRYVPSIPCSVSTDSRLGDRLYHCLYQIQNLFGTITHLCCTDILLI